MAEIALKALGGEAGCTRLAEEFYGRVARDPELRPLFPGKSLRCATEALAAFLVQFFDGDEKLTQSRWWLSLRESHARFHITPAQRRAWLRDMENALAEITADEDIRSAFRDFFEQSSAYIMGAESTAPKHPELGARWDQQLALDAAVAAIQEGRDDEATALAARFEPRAAVFAALLARMVECGRPRLLQFATTAVQNDPTLVMRRFSGRTLLHVACGSGAVELAALLFRLGADPNIAGRGGHPPLYSVANECATGAGPELVRLLVETGADVNAASGVTRATPLHMAARRGFVEIARTLLENGASVDARDRKGDTPLRRAIQCRKQDVARLLSEWGAR